MMMLAWACLLSIAMLSAQGVEEVTLVVSGDGPTKEEATHVALRSAIEQAFGCFVSANTEILNDSLVKDEIVTISNGSISSYEEINVTELNSALLSVTLRATVSVNKLISYAKSKGSSCELSGALLSQEKRMLEMNIANTKKALNHLFTLVNEYVAKNDLWEYTFKIENVKMNGYVTGEITCKRNQNADYLEKMIDDYLAAMAIDGNQQRHLREIGFECYGIHGHGLYADKSCVSKELWQSINKNIAKRACVLFTDNLGFVYTQIPWVWPNVLNIKSRESIIQIHDIRWYYDNPNSITQQISLQIPDENLAALSKIELVPYSDPRFANLVGAMWEQAWQSYRQLDIKMGNDITQEETYYFFEKMALYFSIRERIFTPSDYTEEEINQLKKWLKEQETGWAGTAANMEVHFHHRIAAEDILTQIERMLVQIEGEEYKKQIEEHGVAFRGYDGKIYHTHIGDISGVGEWYPAWNTDYFQKRSTISE